MTDVEKSLLICLDGVCAEDGSLLLLELLEVNDPLKLDLRPDTAADPALMTRDFLAECFGLPSLPLLDPLDPADLPPKDTAAWNDRVDVER